MIHIRVMVLYKGHERRKAVVEKQRNDRGEPDTREEARVSGEMKWKECIVPVMEPAELLHRVTENDLSDRDDKETREEEDPQFLFARHAHDEVNTKDRDPITEEKREIHIAVIDHAFPEKHPDILKTKAQKGNYDYEGDVIID